MALKKISATTGVAFITLLLLLLSPRANAQNPILSVEDGNVWVKGIEPEVLYTFKRYFNSQEDWENVFPVTVQQNSNGIVISGSYEIFPDAIRFQPRFTFSPNVLYQAKFFAEQLSNNPNEVYLPSMNPATLQLEFSFKASEETASMVTAVYPSASELPENLLKFHVSFTKSMNLGEAFEKIKLLDSLGNEIENPFLVLDQELWDPEMKTLTILFDPGRIKRGLRPNLEMKPALAANNRYSLVIEKGWKDIEGNFTKKTFVKTFTCKPADRKSPEVSTYAISVSPAPTAALVIDLKEPMDRVMLANAIRVKDERGNIVEGIIFPQYHESVIEFVPKNPWSETHYTIEFNPLLEDLAGNNVNRLFDKDLHSPNTSNRPTSSVLFTIPNTSR